MNYKHVYSRHNAMINVSLIAFVLDRLIDRQEIDELYLTKRNDHTKLIECMKQTFPL